MKIKHFAGYGSVTATKIQKKPMLDRTFLKVEVIGNHEWGLYRPDKYDLKRWLIDRFDKTAKDVSPYSIEYTYEGGYRKINGLDTEYAIYSFLY